jgi:small subunit ribosomal protein S6
MFIVRPDAVEEDVDKLIAGFSATVTSGGGVVKTVEKMGRRKLAYTVRKFNDGNYVLLTVEADGAGVLELERRLDEEEKRLAKVKAARGVRRKVEPTVPAVAAPAAVATPAAVAAPVAAVPVVEAPAEVVAPAVVAEPAQASV